ncbi:hypothetical protein BO71DRAFT_378830 [Aspergillus ellipticus CBS 707.79]|uniref:Uncharacterized protein n=1 Tax=Aspergillus ellipticus CBS 707.79 TaxID=1448320 RepID=A0A319DC87_9EURO|nr:hypothetical protein BO71DRAFT_378830 [Aspergillus ellipticus CBS 707.79]
MSNKPLLSIPVLLTLTLTTLSLFTFTVLLLTPYHILPRILLPVCQNLDANPERTHGRPFYERPELERTSTNTSAVSADEPRTWESLLLPPSGGGIRSYTDPDTKKDTDDEEPLTWGISMMHQLHCLIVLRGIVFPETTENKINSTSQAHSDDVKFDSTHWAHCFDYIAQGILCAADDTIERPRDAVNGHGKTVSQVDGEGSVHQCRDARVLWEASMGSMDEPVDLADWREGVGVRTFMGKTVERMTGVPKVYTLGMK